MPRRRLAGQYLDEESASELGALLQASGMLPKKSRGKGVFSFGVSRLRLQEHREEYIPAPTMDAASDSAHHEFVVLNGEKARRDTRLRRWGVEGGVNGSLD